MCPNIIIFGARSPLIVDYQMVAHRAGRDIDFVISVNGVSRASFGTKVMNLDEVHEQVRSPIIPCAFSPTRRKYLAEVAKEYNFHRANNLVDPSAILPANLSSGDGGFINAGSVVGAECILGDGVILNRSSSIGHHCVLGDWVSIGPGAIISGNVRIGRLSMIGAGAVLQSDIRIGENVKVAAGSVVRKSVPDNALVSGNPAKVVTMSRIASIFDKKNAE